MMRRNMVNIVEFAHVIDLLDSLASRSVVDAALEANGLTRDVMSVRTGFVPYATEAKLIESVARAVGDRHLGARVGQLFDYRSYGAYSQFVLSAPDLATALERGSRALVLIHPASKIVFSRTKTHVLVGRSSEGLSVVGHRHLDEGSIFVIGYVVRNFLGPDWHPDWIEVPYSGEKGIVALEEIFGVPVRTGSQAPSIAIRRADLLAINPDPSTTRDPISLDSLSRLMGVHPVHDLSEVVLSLLETCYAIGDLSVGKVTELLAIEERSLQRALRKEGTSFRRLRNRFIERKARSLLSKTDMPIEQMAGNLGYSETRSFRRAVKSWTSVSPTAFRKSTREQPARGKT
jgi:AraC-like DNA-binding protein